jgi:hypothetical protein
LCVSGEKCLQTIWDEITSDFEDIRYLNLTQETIWNAARTREMARPLTPVENKRIQEGIPRETVMKESFWRMRPDGMYSGTQEDLLVVYYESRKRELKT